MANRFLEEARQGENAFWRYLVTLFLVIGFAIGGTLVALIIGFLLEGTTDLTAFSNVTYLFVTMSTFPFALLGLWLGINWLHRRPLMSLINPARRINWKRVLFSAGVWVGLSTLSDVVFALLRPGLYTWSFDWKTFIPYALPALILIPIQTATEELIFRGYLTQGFGRLAKGLLLPLFGPALLFGLLHGANPEVTTYGALLTLPTYVLMGLLLGWITLKSESLELALGLHAGNNLYAALAVTFPASAIPSPALFTVTKYDPLFSLVMLVILSAVYLVIVNGYLRKPVMTVGVSALLVMFLVSCSPAPAATVPASATLPLKDCPVEEGLFSQANARCADLEVPENPQDAAGRKINIHVTVIPATSRAAAPDPLVLLAGGPGQSATQSFEPLLPYLRLINEKRDILLFDQRGTGGSNRLSCPISEPAVGDVIGASKPAEEQVQEALTCLDSLDADTRFYTTEIGMQDLDAVRKSLGYDQLNLLGVSYGTRSALTYAQMYPEHTRSLVLDGVAPRGWAIGESVDADARRALGLIFARCQAVTTCNQAFPDLQGQLDALEERLDRQPEQVTIPHPTTGKPVTVFLDGAQLVGTLRLMAYNNEFTSLIPLMIHTANTGQDLQPLAAQVVTLTSGLASSIADGMYLSVICSEDVPLLTQEQTAPGDYFAADTGTLRAICAVWPHADLSVESLQPAPVQASTLLLSGEADPVTPPENAEQAAKYLPNHLSLVVPENGHNVFYRGCLPRIIRQFLEQGGSSGLDTSCVQEIHGTPFFLSMVNPQP